MHKNPVWIILFVLCAVTVIYFTSKAAISLYKYTHLTAKTKSETIDWTVYEKSSDKYFIQANFSFLDDKTKRKGTTIFPNAMHRNRRSAEDAASEIKDQELTVWYSPEKKDIATLSKKFPLKQCLYAVIVWGITLYFIFLGIYVGKQYGKRHS